MWDGSQSLCKECGEMGHSWYNCEKLDRVNIQFGEEPMEPYVDDNLSSGEAGVEITTRAQRRKIMDENKFEYRKKAPAPGARLYFDMTKGSGR